MATCEVCDGQGIVCDECGQGDIPVRTSGYGDYCKACVEKIIEQEEGENNG